jgi:lysine biosynthesis protein LysW
MSEDKKIVCPDCGVEIKTGEKLIEVGDIFECSECGCEIEVTSLNPLSTRTLLEQK